MPTSKARSGTTYFEKEAGMHRHAYSSKLTLPLQYPEVSCSELDSDKELSCIETMCIGLYYHCIRPTPTLIWHRHPRPCISPPWPNGNSSRSMRYAPPFEAVPPADYFFILAFFPHYSIHHDPPSHRRPTSGGLSHSSRTSQMCSLTWRVRVLLPLHRAHKRCLPHRLPLRTPHTSTAPVSTQYSSIPRQHHAHTRGVISARRQGGRGTRWYRVGSASASCVRWSGWYSLPWR
ncbi:hypothetical protein B0H19DRAFT_85156 [Mycena capillaripes]|nr:hypothetical protein B0H19DRAFT_85156 [Mycena capillaripes]